jgi:hypothetical protein
MHVQAVLIPLWYFLVLQKMPYIADELLGICREGTPEALEEFFARNRNFHVDTDLSDLFGRENDRMLHFAIYFNNEALVRHMVEALQADLWQRTR